MSQPELLKKVVKLLDSEGIEYMVTGSVVSSLQGEPRSTHDIDLLVSLDVTAVELLTNAFPIVWRRATESVLPGGHDSRKVAMVENVGRQ